MVKTIITKMSTLNETKVIVDVWKYTKTYLSVWTYKKNGNVQDQIMFTKQELEQMLKALS